MPLRPLPPAVAAESRCLWSDIVTCRATSAHDIYAVFENTVVHWDAATRRKTVVRCPLFFVCEGLRAGREAKGCASAAKQLGKGWDG